MTDQSSATATERLRDRWNAAMMPNYGTPAIALARGEGCRVWDVDGNAYLDLFAGIAVSALGHAHPALVSAVSAQVARVAHTSNLFVHEGGVALAERLLGLLGAEGRVFFANSGAEANEAALKLVKRAASPERTQVVATEHGFHGRTSGALALTGKASIRDPFGPFGIDVRFVDYGDVEALRAAVGPNTAAVFVEPTQGEAGIVPPPPDYLRAVREITRDSGAAFVLDEIQSGIGRTGRWFAHQSAGVVPDVLTLAKGLGGGMPIGACIGFGSYGTLFRPGDHGSTFGGNPVAVAAALAVLDTIEDDDLLGNAEKVGQRLAGGVREIEHPMITAVRGGGLWLGVGLDGQLSGAVQTAAAEAGYLVNAVAPDVVRLAPPLIITTDEVESFLAALPGILDTASTRAQAAP